MPANLPPQYYELERQFRAERDTREKLRMAEELLTMMPKHKGTDKLQADMKTKISKLKKDLEQQTHAHVGGHVSPHDHIVKEGAGQVILIGPPNSGKSSLLGALTHAKPLIADYPYSTREPMAGMMAFETIQFQLIDTPPISHESFETYLINLTRNADVVALVGDASDPAGVEAVSYIVEQLREKKILMGAADDPVTDDIRFIHKRTILTLHKALESDDSSDLSQWKQLMPNASLVPTSLLDDTSLASFRRAVFDILKIMRVYTKQVGQEAKLESPVVLSIGGTVAEAATAIHKEFAAKLKFARVWGPGKFEGQRVQADFVLSDGDIVEFHI